MNEREKKRRRRMPWLVLAVAMGAGIAGAGAGVILGGTGNTPHHTAAPSALKAQLPAWGLSMRDGLRKDFSWLDLGFAERVLKVMGEAPDRDAKTAAFTAVRAALDANAEANAAVGVVVDGISVTGGEAGVGAALAALGPNPDRAACQTAFDATLSGRFVAFETGSARISAESATLLDALTGAAFLCKAHRIEIGGHTDRQGADRANLRLSQARADAVRAYLLDKGVVGDSLTAVGYGETQPVDPADTPEAYAKNRRIAFKLVD